MSEKQIILPGIYDCISARAVELVGFEAAFIGSRDVAYSWCGVPDIGLVNADEVLWLASRIAAYIPFPLVVSIGNGYGGSGMVYRTVKRLVKAGIDSVILDDTSECCGYDRGTAVKVISEEDWVDKIQAARKAAENTDCLIIAKSCARYQYNLDEAIGRCQKAREAGADVTAVEGLKNIREAQMLADCVGGDKLWSDLHAQDGRLEIDLFAIKNLGFSLISLYYTEEAAMCEMLDFARQNLKNGNTVYHDQHDFDGMLKPGEDYHKFFSFHKTWIPMEKEFLDVKELSALPNFVKDESYGT